jgi:hypothetical protein
METFEIKKSVSKLKIERKRKSIVSDNDLKDKLPCRALFNLIYCVFKWFFCSLYYYFFPFVIIFVPMAKLTYFQHDE